MARALAGPGKADRAGGSGRPNVLVVMCDQLRYDVFSYLGHSVMSTPNIDRLVEEGVLFTDAICTYPLCGPSRAAMLTGCYCYNDHYVPKNREPDGEDVIARETRTVDQALNAAGYHVEYHGKWHTGNGHRDCYRGGKELFGHKLRGYHDYLAARYTPPSGPGYRVEGYTQWPYRQWPVDNILSKEASEAYNIYHSNAFGVMEIADEDTLTAFTVRQTIEFIERRPPEPFAATCSILHPHLPYTPNETYAAMFDPAAMPMPANIHAHHFQPLSLQPGKKVAIPELLPEGGAGLGQCMALYYALVKEIDDWVGRLLGALDDGGYTDNTLVVFVSDHGHLLGSHNAIEKFQFYEESIRVPLIMRLPSAIPAGLRTDVPATGADIAPTILDYCGVPPLPQFHGRSLQAAIEGPAGSGRAARTLGAGVAGTHGASRTPGAAGAGGPVAAARKSMPPVPGPGDDTWAFCENRFSYCCFRSHEWKVAFDPDDEPVMVFDLANDPGEFDNVVETDRGRVLAAGLKARIPATKNPYWKTLERPRL